MITSSAEQAAMRRALALATSPGVPTGPNPRVGCVLLDRDGLVIGEGWHRGAGSPHAEVDALRRAGKAAHGATAVVTLEPCNHTGRTGPCAQALVDAGVRRVVFGQGDPNPLAAGGAATLRAAGVQVEGGLCAAEARAVNREWTFAMDHDRPFVTWKFATTLDGRSAAPDGTSRWVSSKAARIDTHRLRALCDTMLVGTRTVEVDDPLLTVRDPDDPANGPLGIQPLRAVMGLRDLSAECRVFDYSAPSVHLRTRDPQQALKELFERDRQHVFLEGGPTLAAAFWQAGLIDEVVTYVAPMLLGSGTAAVGDLGINTIADAAHLQVNDVTVLDPVEPGDDVNVRLTMSPAVMFVEEGMQHASRDPEIEQETLMFTGIVEELGTVAAIEDQGDAVRLTVRARAALEGTGLGDSISVNGCCLTVASVEGDTWTADVMQETLDKTSLAGVTPGDRVNLERAMTADKRLGGHLVQGHVDGVGVVVRRKTSKHWEVVEISLPVDLARYVVPKGSITVDGVSLTVVNVRPDSFTVSLIPETLARTTLGIRQPGDKVNLETDVIARHVEKLITAYLPGGAA